MKLRTQSYKRSRVTSTLIICAFTLFFLPELVLAKSPSDSILSILNTELDKSQSYYTNKENRIEYLRQQFPNQKSKEDKFDIIDRIFEEYITYQYDSAFTYARQSNEISLEINNIKLKAKAVMNMMHCFIAAGLFKEGFELISTINPNDIPDTMKTDYYWLCMRYYVNLMQYNDSEYFNRIYQGQALEYFKKAQELQQPGTPEYAQLYLFGYILQDVTTEQKIEKYLDALRNYNFSDRNLATVYTLLAREYKRNKNNEKATHYYALSCLCDIRMAIRQTTSKTFLGEVLYKEGNIHFASKCIEASLEDANFYNARHRKIEVNSILPIIEYERVKLIQEQRDKLTLFMSLLGILVIALTIAMFIIYKQMKKLRKARKSIQEQYNEISTINNKLEETNHHLEQSKKQLEESNDIKDVYITQSLYGKSEYLERFENLLKKVERKIAVRQFDDLKNLYRDYNIKKERENMFSDFDKTFLILFPDFIQEFNKLFNKEDKIQPDEDGNFAPELRIFALIRLGVTDNERISKFLNLTVKTVYSYKSRLKNKSLIPSEEFEYRIMRIHKR